MRGAGFALQNTITKDLILSISNADVYERGEKYYRDGKLLYYNNAQGSTGDDCMVRASVEGNYKNYEVALKLDTRGNLVSYTCSCESHSIWSGACKHVVAVLCAHAEGHVRIFSAEKMRQHAHNLTESLEKIVFEGIDEGLSIPTYGIVEPLMKLAPTINHSANKGIYLTFSVGYSRMYVIKNIAGFVKSCKTRETISYGQGLSFAHCREIFDEPSRKLLDFIIREEDMYAEIGKRISKQYHFSYYPMIAGRELYVTERNIDEVFCLFEGQTLDAVGDFGLHTTFLNASPNFSLNIRHTPTGSILYADAFDYYSIIGQTSYYFLCVGGFYRLSKTDGQLLRSLLLGLAETPSREIVLNGSCAIRFQTIILPRLNNMGIIGKISGEAITGNVSPLVAKMYFDSDDMDVIGRLEFHYGDIVFNALTNTNDTAKDETDSSTELIRDIVTEYALRRRLASLGFYESEDVYRLSGSTIIYAFLQETNYGMAGITTLKDCAEIFITDNLKKKTIVAKSPKIGLRLTGELLRVSLEDSGYEIAELLEALEAYRAKKKFYRLKDGRFIALDNESVVATANFLEALDITRKEVKGKCIALPAYRSLYVDELTRTNAIANTHLLKRDAHFERFLSHFKNNASLGFKMPKSLDKTLREYQKTGYIWLKTIAYYGFGGILADDMGLGKTLQVIALLLSERKNSLPSIVVCPTSLLYNWENEIAKFAPKIKTQVVSGLPDKRHELLNTNKIDVFITTYDMLKRDIEFYKDKEFSFIIAD